MAGRGASSPSSDVLLIVRNAVSAYGHRAVLGASVLVLTPFLFRKLGAGGFGTWSVIFSVATTFSLVEVGFGRGVSKVTAELLDDDRRAERMETISAAVATLAGLGVLAAAASVALAVFAPGLAAHGLRHEFQLGLIVLGVERLIAFPFSAYGAVLLGYQRYDLYNICGVVQTLGFTIAAIAVVQAGFGVLGVTIAFAAAHLVMVVLCAVLLRRADPHIALRPRLGARAKRRRIAGFSSYVLFAESMTFIAQRMDTVVIAAIRNAAAAAPFAAAVKLQTALQSLTLPIVYQMMPMASDLWSRNLGGEVVRRLALATRVVLQLTVPVAAAMALFASDLVDLWLGASAPDVTATIVVVLMLAQIATLGAAPAEQTLVGVGAVRAIGLLALLEGVSNLGLSIVLVMHYGAFGAALGTLLTSAVLAPVKLPLAARALGSSSAALLRGSVLPALLSSAPALAIMVVVRLTLPEGAARLLIGFSAGLLSAAAVTLTQIGPTRLAASARRLTGAFGRGPRPAESK